MAPDGVTVISALHTVSAPRSAGDERLDEDVLICGDRKADKARVAALIERIDGLRAVNAGPLEQARIVEPLTAMLIGINSRYKTHAGIQDHRPPRRRPLDHDESIEVPADGVINAVSSAASSSPGAPAGPSSRPACRTCWARGSR